MSRLPSSVRHGSSLGVVMNVTRISQKGCFARAATGSGRPKEHLVTPIRTFAPFVIVLAELERC